MRLKSTGSQKRIKQSTQIYLPISEIKDGIIVLKDGSLRVVLMANAVNFELKSEDEQSAIEYAYQNFLNSLDFPIQILIRSKHLELDSYLKKLEELVKKQENELLQLQTIAYVDQIKSLLEYANIMTKEFYLVIPYYPKVTEKSGLIKNLSKIIKPDAGTVVYKSDFEAEKAQILQRADLCATELGAVGIRCISLNTQELVELYYSLYNPQTSRSEKLVDVTQMTTPLVKRGEKTEDV